MVKTITIKAAKDALINLRKLTPANENFDDDLEVSIKEAVFFMAPDLIQHAKRGFTSKELAAGLAAAQIHINPGTLNRYLNEYLVAKQNVKKSETASKEAKTDDKKAGAQTPESSSPASHSQGENEAEVKQPSSLASKDASPGLNKQSAATLGGKDGGGFDNPKPAVGNPNPSLPSSTVKSEWTRVVDSTAASKSA